MPNLILVQLVYALQHKVTPSTSMSTAQVEANCFIRQTNNSDILSDLYAVMIKYHTV